MSPLRGFFLYNGPMQEQHRLTPGPLLNEKGDLVEAGYACSLVKDYDKSMVKGGSFRLKEWDYYYVGNSDYGVALTVADNSYMGMVSVSVLDFKAKFDVTKSIIVPFTRGKWNLPTTSKTGDVEVSDSKKGYSFRFLNLGQGKRRLVVFVKSMDKLSTPFHCDIALEETSPNSMVIATPFAKKAHFYYSQKINNQIAHGYAKFGDRMLDFNSSSFGVLDWGRGVWTYRNTWYWCSVSSCVDGHLLGWNLGYGFGDTSKASENMLFLDDKAIKLGGVCFDIPISSTGGDDFMKDWLFRFKDDSFELRFHPIYDRHSDTSALIIRSNQHQVFGVFSGSFLVDGKPFSFSEVPGFAEKVFNKW